MGKDEWTAEDTAEFDAGSIAGFLAFVNYLMANSVPRPNDFNEIPSFLVAAKRKMRKLNPKNNFCDGSNSLGRGTYPAFPRALPPPKKYVKKKAGEVGWGKPEFVWGELVGIFPSFSASCTYEHLLKKAIKGGDIFRDHGAVYTFFTILPTTAKGVPCFEVEVFKEYTYKVGQQVWSEKGERARQPMKTYYVTASKGKGKIFSAFSKEDIVRWYLTRTLPDAGPAGRDDDVPDAGPAGRDDDVPDAGPAGRDNDAPDAGPAGRDNDAPDAGAAGPAGRDDAPDAGAAGPAGRDDAPDAGAAGQDDDASPA